MEKVLAIVGPTAVGKTALSIEIAKKFNGEIINGDSVQVYKKLDIGSAKITHEEMDGVVHHLIDFKEPNEDFSVYEFQKLVREKIHDITSRHKLPIIVGGTGLYLQAVLYDFKFEDEGRNQTFNKKFEALPNETLHQLLNEIDPNSAKLIHPNNRRRVLRALEIYENSQMTKSELFQSQEKLPLFNFLIIGLDMDRKTLYNRINLRVDLMIKEGLEQEVRNLYKMGYRVNPIGYKEFYPYFENKQTLEETTELIKKNTRHYAKRQLTYFRNKLDIHWLQVDLQHKDQLLVDAKQVIEDWLNNVD